MMFSIWRVLTSKRFIRIKKVNRTRIIRVKVDRFQMPQISYDPKSVFKFDFRLKIFYVELKKKFDWFLPGRKSLLYSVSNWWSYNASAKETKVLFCWWVWHKSKVWSVACRSGYNDWSYWYSISDTWTTETMFHQIFCNLM